METAGTLSVVATPIGNLEDITYRAVRTLTECDYVLCEDTRVTGKLLAHYQIDTPMKRYDAHASDATHAQIIHDLQHGVHVALVSDAGTPGISDPGVRLLQLLRTPHGAADASPLPAVRIEAIPGPSALTAAISIAGIPGNQFTFLGFVPQKKGRETFFRELANHCQPVICFESPHRIMKTLQTLATQYPQATVHLARELTKHFEEFLSGTAGTLLATLETAPKKQRGEFVLIVEVS